MAVCTSVGLVAIMTFHIFVQPKIRDSEEKRREDDDQSLEYKDEKDETIRSEKLSVSEWLKEPQFYQACTLISNFV